MSPHRQSFGPVRRLMAMNLVAFGVFGYLLQVGDRRDSDRDQALKYQRCAQLAEAAVQTNAANKSDEILARRRLEFQRALNAWVQATRSGPTDVRERLHFASLALQASAKAAVKQPRQPVPDCKRTYPQGYRVSSDVGDVAPTIRTEP